VQQSRESNIVQSELLKIFAPGQFKCLVARQQIKNECAPTCFARVECTKYVSGICCLILFEKTHLVPKLLILLDFHKKKVGKEKEIYCQLHNWTKNGKLLQFAV
jgi:hypothetical protein